MVRKVVDFPAPLAPMSVTIAPADTWKEIPRTTSMAP
jgi:hypothetical protein